MITAAEQLQYMKIEAPAWVTATAYNYGDYVTQSGTVYECIVAHTSGTFNTDLTNLKWTASHFIQKSCDYAIARVNAHLNTDFRSGTYTKEFKGEGTNNYYAPVKPITSVSSIEFFDMSLTPPAYATIFGSGDTIANSVKVLTDSGEIILYNGYMFSKGTIYKIVLVGGAAANEHIKGACHEIAALFYKKSYQGDGSLGLTSRNMAGQGTESAGFNYEQAILDALKSVEMYRVYNV